MQTLDTLIHAGWIITVNETFDVLPAHAIGIHQGRIVAIEPSQGCQLQANAVLHLPQHVVMPGLINSHGHAAMSLMRGLADDLQLMTWLQQYIWPAEQQHVDAGFVEDGSLLAITEMLRSGTTCFSDMYFFPDVTARLCESIGMRAQLSFPIFDIPTNWGADAEDYLQKGLQVAETLQGSELVQIALGPHAPYTIGDEALAKVKQVAGERALKVQMHLHETAFEVDSAVKENGQRPLQRLQQLGLLNRDFQAVHMTCLSADDIQLIAENGCHIIHCPESNLKLASGFCPVQQCLDAGINVALGTDGAASNNDLDMFSEMRTAAMLGKAVAGDATAVSAEQAIRMATINGAKALGLDAITGSLKTGKAADIIALDFSGLAQQPLYNPVSQLVYTNASPLVSHAWVNGVKQLENGQLTRIDINACRERTQHWQQTLKPLAG